ncbi:MAG: hypothetical protein M5U34_04260 [Chloroflexi bacterium]|nr:hypothetical protein [Chloroflexota bacterium]
MQLFLAKRRATSYPPLQSLLLSPDEYPPSTTPYWIAEGDFWLVHTLEGKLFAFAPQSPTYSVARPST